MPKGRRAPTRASPTNKPRRTSYTTCNISDLDDIIDGNADVEAWGATTKLKTNSGRSRRRSIESASEDLLSSLQGQWQALASASFCCILLLVLLLDPASGLPAMARSAARSVTGALPPPAFPPPSPQPPVSPPPPPAPPPSAPSPSDPPPSIPPSPSPPPPPYCPPTPLSPPPPEPPSRPPPPATPPNIPPSPHQPGWNIAQDVNARFRAARNTGQLATSGVLIHVLDGISDPDKPWLPCKAGDCAVYGDRFAASLIYPGHQDVYQGGKDGWQKGGGLGFVLNPSQLKVNCAYYADAGSQGKVCDSTDPKFETCLPGCEDWCEPSRGAYNFGGCGWKPTQLKLMIEQQKTIKPDGGYNEIVIDAASWVNALPRTIQAVFLCLQRAPEGGNWPLNHDPGKLWWAKDVHEKFITEYGLSPDDVPLLLFDQNAFAEPFQMMDGV